MNPEQYLDALLSLPGMVISQSRMVNQRSPPTKNGLPGAGIVPAPPPMFTRTHWMRRTPLTLLRAHPPDRNSRKFLHHRMDARFPRRDHLSG